MLFLGQAVLAGLLQAAEAGKEGISKLRKQITTQSEPVAVLGVIGNWSDAWTRLDVEAYLSHYHPEFQPESYKSHGHWSFKRREHFAKQRWVKISISGISLLAFPDGSYTANFIQNYRSDTYHDVIRKELSFTHHKGKWVITSEKAIPVKGG